MELSLASQVLSMLNVNNLYSNSTRVQIQIENNKLKNVNIMYSNSTHKESRIKKQA